MPAGEDSLARRRHVCSRVIPQSRDSLTQQLDLEKIFGRRAPLHVDLGCGEGSFLCTLAERLPDKNFLGIERLLGRIRSSARKAASLGNVLLLQMESSYAVHYLLPVGSVETFYLLFPDPWPKRRHHRRRIVTPDFLNSVYITLQMNGVIYTATDHLDYSTRISRLAEESSLFAFMQPSGEDDFPASAFEKKFASTGARIYRLELRKVSPVM